MQRSEIATTVIEIIVDNLGVDESKVTEEANILDDLGADSLDTVELVMAFEERFGIELSDEDSEKFLTPRDIIDHIEKLKNA